jgi:bifunctional DNase/RNase
MVIYGVSFDMVGKQPIVLLKTVDGNKFLPIWIGHPEAASILMKLQGATTPRPMTHDLLNDVLGELEVKCTQVAVTELRENTFFASITLAINGRELEIDSRPSDAIALAVRAGAPIFAADEVIAESAIEFEHEVEEADDVVEKFKEFLDQVSPEDFAAGRLASRRRASATSRGPAIRRDRAVSGSCGRACAPTCAFVAPAPSGQTASKSCRDPMRRRPRASAVRRSRRRPDRGRSGPVLGAVSP